VLCDLAPTTARVAALMNTENPAEQGMDAAVRDAAAKKGRKTTGSSILIP
jgi:hypothetical protein